jgi:hypothetical protein
MSTNDERFESHLRAVTSEADAVPEHVVADAKALFALRDLDAELAQLVADSLVDEPAVLTRALIADVRMLSFLCGDVTIELDVDTDPVTGRVSLHGAAVGVAGDVVVVLTGHRVVSPLDQDGHFDLQLPTGGPLRLELTKPDGGRVTTPWITV